MAQDLINAIADLQEKEALEIVRGSYNYVRDLVNLLDSTGPILCPGRDAPINTWPENMEAFVAASQKFSTASI